MDEAAPFQIKKYNPYEHLPVPCAIVLLGGALAAIHAPQAWNGRQVKALASVAMGMSVAIAAIVSAALEWTRIQQSNTLVQAHIDGLNSDLEEANSKYDKETDHLNQDLTALKEEGIGQATTIEQQETRLRKYTELEKILRAQIGELGPEMATLTQQLKELQEKSDGQATAMKKLKDQLDTNRNNLNEKARLAEELDEKHRILLAKKESVETRSTNLTRQLDNVKKELSEARGLGTDGKSVNIQKEVLKTEETFLKQMTELRDLLEGWCEAKSITEQQFVFLSKGLDGVIKYATNLLNKGVDAYYDIEFMKEYYGALTIMVMNFKGAGELLKSLKVQKLSRAESILAGPTQRVGRHRMLFEELLKTSPAQKALKELKAIADRVNTSQRCNDELEEIQKILATVVRDRGKKKTTNLAECAKNLVGVEARDATWVEYWFGEPNDLNVALQALVDKLSRAANIIEDKQILKKIKACALCLSEIISNDNNNNESPTELLLKLVEDKISRSA